MPVAGIALNPALRLAAKVEPDVRSRRIAPRTKPSVGCDASPGARQIRADLHECGVGQALVRVRNIRRNACQHHSERGLTDELPIALRVVILDKVTRARPGLAPFPLAPARIASSISRYSVIAVAEMLSLDIFVLAGASRAGFRVRCDSGQRAAASRTQSRGERFLPVCLPGLLGPARSPPPCATRPVQPRPVHSGGGLVGEGCPRAASKPQALQPRSRWARATGASDCSACCRASATRPRTR